MKTNNVFKIVFVFAIAIVIGIVGLAFSPTNAVAAPASQSSNPCDFDGKTATIDMLKNCLASKLGITSTVTITLTPVLPPPAPITTTLLCTDVVNMKPADIFAQLVPDARERTFLTMPQFANDHWIVQTAKLKLDPAGNPCCGPVITFSLQSGGAFIYWRSSNDIGADFGKPTGNTSTFTVAPLIDPVSGLPNWQVDAVQGSDGKIRSDGVSWYPLCKK